MCGHFLKTLPDECTLEDIQYHLYVMEKIQGAFNGRRPKAPFRKKKLNGV
jgi:hypothetical protein